MEKRDLGEADDYPRLSGSVAEPGLTPDSFDSESRALSSIWSLFSSLKNFFFNVFIYF